MKDRVAAEHEQGFSLAEMLVAMVVTLIVASAIYGMLGSGQGVFRREPSVIDRQQSIRVAMNLIQRDLATAGSGMGAFARAFTDGLNNLGPAAFPSVINAGERSDFIRILGNDGECPDVPVDGTDGANAVTTKTAFPSCYPEPGMLLLIWPDGTSRFGWGFNIHTQDKKVNFPPGQQPPLPWSEIHNPADLTVGGNPPGRIITGQMIEYRIAADPSDGTPALWRSMTGGFDPGTGLAAGPPGATWQLIARGIEDFQVEYRKPGGAFAPTPGTVVGGDYTSIVQEIRVTLSARALDARVGGETLAGGVRALRGQLTTITSPRAALLGLAEATPPLWQ